MFLIKFLFWLITLPFRLVLWVVGLALWLLTLPLRIVFGVLGFIGFGRLFQLSFLAVAGYYFYRLLTSHGSDDEGVAPPSESTLRSYPAT